MEIFLTKVYPETIMIMVKWSINDFLQYILIQVRHPRKGISTLITNNQDFYTIADAYIVYHTQGKDDNKTNRLNLHRRRK